MNTIYARQRYRNRSELSDNMYNYASESNYDVNKVLP